MPNPRESFQGPTGRSREGWPIYRYLDPGSEEWRHIVVLPDGRVFYSDAAGHIGHTGKENNAVLGATLFGLGGLLVGGPIGGIVGAIIGAIGSEALARKKAA